MHLTRVASSVHTLFGVRSTASVPVQTLYVATLLRVISICVTSSLRYDHVIALSLDRYVSVTLAVSGIVCDVLCMHR